MSDVCNTGHGDNNMQSSYHCNNNHDDIDHLCMSLCLWHSSAGKLDVVNFLVTTGRADVNSKDKYGQTPLHLACK